MDRQTLRLAPRLCVSGLALLTLVACDNGLDFDMRGKLGNRFDTSNAAAQATQDRPQPDARGVITYPNYQVAVARSGDTVSSIAARIGADAQDLARYNGLDATTVMRRDEVLALRNPVSVVPGSFDTGAAPGAVDITALAQGAIDSAPVTSTALPPAPAAGPEPVRHKVERGETAFTIARLYNVSVRALADWNGLDSNFALREGQFLLIPVAASTTQTAALGPAPLSATTAPGLGTPTPTPPSATQPLPQEDTRPVAEPVETPPAPDLTPSQPVSTASGRLSYPVSGPIVREYTKGKNDGIGIGSSAGTPVKAADAGTVMAVTETTDDQTILVVQHPNNVLTVYANIAGISVKKGDRVSRGQSIAAVKDSFLHFEVREGFDSVDPLPYLQ